MRQDSHGRAGHGVCTYSVLMSCPTLWDPMDCSPPDSSVHGFSRQEYWSRLPFSPPGDLPNPGNKPTFLALAGELFTTKPNSHRPWHPAPKEEPVMSTKMRGQVLEVLRGYIRQKGVSAFLRTTLTNSNLRPVRMAAWVIEIRCFVLAEAVQQKDARNLKMACDPDWEMLRVDLVRMRAFSEQHQRICFNREGEKAEESEIKLPTSVGLSKKQESSRKISISPLLAMPMPLTVWITINWKILQ